MVLAETFNEWTFGVAVVALVALIVILKVGRGFNLRFKNIEAGVSNIDKQVNRVENPETDPTVRELIVAMHEMQTEQRGDLANMRRDTKQVNRRLASLEATQLAAQERLAAVGRLSRETADAVKKLEPKENIENDS